MTGEVDTDDSKSNGDALMLLLLAYLFDSVVVASSSPIIGEAFPKLGMLPSSSSEEVAAPPPPAAAVASRPAIAAIEG